MKYAWVIWSAFFTGWDLFVGIDAFVEGDSGKGWFYLAFALVMALLTWFNVWSARKQDKWDKELAQLNGQLLAWDEIKRINDEWKKTNKVQDEPQYGERI